MSLDSSQVASWGSSVYLYNVRTLFSLLFSFLECLLTNSKLFIVERQRLYIRFMCICLLSFVSEIHTYTDVEEERHKTEDGDEEYEEES